MCFREVYFNCTVFEVRLCYNVVRFMFFDVERYGVGGGRGVIFEGFLFIVEGILFVILEFGFFFRCFLGRLILI